MRRFAAKLNARVGAVQEKARRGESASASAFITAAVLNLTAQEQAEVPTKIPTLNFAKNAKFRMGHPVSRSYEIRKQNGGALVR